MPGIDGRAVGRTRMTALLASVALVASLGGAPVARAATTLYVGPGGGPGGCAAPAYTTITAAVSAAVTGDTIHICAATYNLAATVETSPKDLTFAGDGAATTIVDGGGRVRLFNATGRAIAVSGLTLRSGHSGIRGGGAILAGSATVTYSTFSGNRATWVGAAIAGGAIAAYAATVTNSTFSGNRATGDGGAISAAIATVTSSTFSGNDAASGGAIAADTATETNSTFSGNSATGDGGAISSAITTVTNSTFSGSSAASGGAIDAGRATVANSTFSGNNADWGGAIDAGNMATVANSTFSGNSAIWGGAIWAGNTAAVANSTFSGNSAAQGGAIWAGNTAAVTNTILASTAPNLCAGGITDGGGSWGTDTSCGLGPSHVVTPAALELGALAANGGPTQTIALGVGSVAIDAGVDAACAAAPVNGLDQRGVARPQGAHCDSGAFELVVVDPAVVVTANDASREYGRPNPAFTFTATGLVGGGQWVTAPGCTTTATLDSPMGTYPITCDGGDPGPNYAGVRYVAGTLTITPAPWWPSLTATPTAVHWGHQLTLAVDAGVAVTGVSAAGAAAEGRSVTFESADDPDGPYASLATLPLDAASRATFAYTPRRSLYYRVSEVLPAVQGATPAPVPAVSNIVRVAVYRDVVLSPSQTPRAIGHGTRVTYTATVATGERGVHVTFRIYRNVQGAWVLASSVTTRTDAAGRATLTRTWSKPGDWYIRATTRTEAHLAGATSNIVRYSVQ